LDNRPTADYTGDGDDEAPVTATVDDEDNVDENGDPIPNAA
jgi:hypothetical protein|tara:strand:- start:148 stop:270 length:123 start_codon:yes stop_codon:yes gene_type:complete